MKHLLVSVASLLFATVVGVGCDDTTLGTTPAGQDKALSLSLCSGTCPEDPPPDPFAACMAPNPNLPPSSDFGQCVSCCQKVCNAAPCRNTCAQDHCVALKNGKARR